MDASLKAAILSKDSALTSLIQAATAKLDIQLLEMDDALRYMDLVSQEPFDFLVVDCEGLPAGKHLVSTLRQSSANREAFVMIAGAPEGPGAMSGFGTHVLLSKPVTPEKAGQCLREAMQVMQESHRRYQRHQVEMDVLVTCETKNWQLRARSMGLSEGGMGLQLPQYVDLGNEDVVSLYFQLPESHDRFELSANLAWINNDLEAGFRFKPLTTSNAARLSAWLNQHAPPLPGASRKEIVESWLAKHGSATDTVVMSAGARRQLLAEKEDKAPAAPAPVEAAVAPAPTSEAQGPSLSAKTIVLIVAGFFLGMVACFLLSRLYHLL